MTWHPTDDDLILHFYGEDPADERRVDDHLRDCAACRDAWTEISETLKLVDAAAPLEPAAGFERVMWARVQQALPARHVRRAWWAPRYLVPLAGLAAIAVAAIVAAGHGWSLTPPLPEAGSATQTASPASSTAAARQARERVLLAAAGDHFAQAEVVLVELMNGPDVSHADIGFERQTADDLVAAGRLYRETARQNGDSRLVQMLEDLESVLVEVARSPEQVGRQDLQSLRARIDHDGLLFKVRAVGHEIQERQKTLSTASEGSL